MLLASGSGLECGFVISLGLLRIVFWSGPSSEGGLECAYTPTPNDGSRSSYAACPTSQEINDLGPCDSSSSLASTDTPAASSTPARRTGDGRQNGRRIDGGAAARPAQTVRQSRTSDPSPFSPVDLGADARYLFVNGWVG